MKIEFINYPYVFTTEGTRHNVSEITGIPRVGAILDKALNVLSQDIDTDCINGVCPVK